MSDCIFCQIIAGDIPNYTVYEDREYLAFLDISQFVDGHTLLIPKKHHRWIWDMPDISGYYKIAQKIAKHYQAVTGKELVVSMSFGEQVPHAHLHIMPDTQGMKEIHTAWEHLRTDRASRAASLDLSAVAQRFYVSK